MVRWAAVLVLVTGCSMITLPGRGPHPQPPIRSSCPLTASIVDTAAAVVAAGAAVAGGYYATAEWNEGEAAAAFIAFFGAPVIIATVYAVSARHGWRWRCACQRMLDNPVDTGP